MDDADLMDVSRSAVALDRARDAEDASVRAEVRRTIAEQAAERARQLCARSVERPRFAGAHVAAER